MDHKPHGDSEGFIPHGDGGTETLPPGADDPLSQDARSGAHRIDPVGPQRALARRRDVGEEKGRFFRRRQDPASLLGYPLSRVALPHRFRQHRTFLRQLYRASMDDAFEASLIQLRDSILRASLKANSPKGMTIALAGVNGGEDTRLLSLLLSIALGARTRYMVSYLDGEFETDHFDVLASVLRLSENTSRLGKERARLTGFYNLNQPNIYFLRSSYDEQSMDFFSDKQLKTYLDTLRNRFDFTVISMPPMSRASANVFLAPAVDRLYLVGSAGRTRLAELDRCLELAEESQTKIDGVILNHQRAPFWSHFFWRRYFF